MGTLEAMLVTPTKVDTIVVSSSLWDYLFATFRILIFLLLGVFLFGVNMSDANLFAAMIILILTIFCFSSLGIISASFTMVFKRGDTVNWVFGSVSALLGGVTLSNHCFAWLAPNILVFVADYIFFKGYETCIVTT